MKGNSWDHPGERSAQRQLSSQLSESISYDYLDHFFTFLHNKRYNNNEGLLDKKSQPQN